MLDKVLSCNPALNRDLDYFVCFSSIASGWGNAGQSNYGFANSTVEQVVRLRNRNAANKRCVNVAIQWGPIGDVGVLAERDLVQPRLIGVTHQRIHSCLQVLERVLFSRADVVSSVMLADDRLQLWSAHHQHKDILESVLHVLGLQRSQCPDHSITLGELGMDSLMAVEIKQNLERECGRVFSTQQLRSMTFGQLKILNEQVRTEPNADRANRMEDALSPAKHSCDPTRQQDMSDWKFLLHDSSTMFVKLQALTEALPVFFFGSYHVSWNEMCELSGHLNRTAYAFDWKSQLDDCESIEQLAHQIVIRMIKQNQTKSIDLVGIGFGCLLVLEVAAQLEAKLGTTAVRVCILLDGSPDLIRAEAQEWIESSKNEQEAFYDALIQVSKSLVSLKDAQQLRLELIRLNDANAAIKAMALKVENECKQAIDTDLLEKAAKRQV